MEGGGEEGIPVPMESYHEKIIYKKGNIGFHLAIEVRGNIHSLLRPNTFYRNVFSLYSTAMTTETILSAEILSPGVAF